MKVIPRKSKYAIQFTTRGALAFIAALVVAATFFNEWRVSEAQKLRCASFSSQIEAQDAFNSDPRRYSKLDGDKDGLACEAYRYKR